MRAPTNEPAQAKPRRQQASVKGQPSPGLAPGDDVFAALADSTRRRILEAVSEHGPITATSLAENLPISRQAVAKHLGLLRDAGLVTADKAGRETRFVARPDPLDELATWAQDTGRRWDDRLARLRDLTTRHDHGDQEV